MHGFALNCDCDLIGSTASSRRATDATGTSLTTEAGRAITVAEAMPYVEKRLAEVFRAS